MKKVLFVLSSLLVFFALPSAIFAARLNTYPSSAVIKSGQSVSVSVILSSSDQPANAVSGKIIFPTDKLQVVSISKAGSIISLWVEEPSYSNITGTVSFQGIVPNPGYQGGRGTVLNIVFKAIKSGNADISLQQTSVLANDGSGTNILTDTQGSAITISGQTQEEKPTETVVQPSDPDAILITSKTHPVPNKWYNVNDVELSWALPNNVTSTRYSFDKDAKATLSETDTPPITKQMFNNVSDGLWYFRIQGKRDGKWGNIYTYKIYIDTTAPEIKAFDLVNSDNNSGSPSLLLKSSDDLSGVSQYKVKFGDRPYESFDAANNGEQMSIPAKYPGKQVVIVEVSDSAGNKSIQAKEFNIITFDAPKITDMPSILDKGQGLVIRGTAVPNTEVRVYLKGRDDKEVFESTQAGSAGDFQLTWKEPIPDGSYTVSADSVNNFGVFSPRSNEKNLSVHPSILFRIGSFVVTVGSFVAFMIVVLLGMGYGGLILWKHFHRFRRSLSKEMEMIDRSVHTAFNMLKEEIRTEVKALEKAKTKRKLTREEERIIEKFSTDVDDAERFIEKQIRDVKRKTE